MKFNTSIKAFILSFLITGNLALLLWGYQIGKRETLETETEYDIEVLADLLEEELQEELAQSSSQTTTHKAFNETRKELTALNNDSQEDQDDFDQRLKALDEAIKDVEAAKDNPSIEKADPYEAAEQKAVDGNDGNTSIRYRLVDRNALYVPNPVYTCSKSGTVVVNITVDNQGRVIGQQINENSSDTTDGCLWDAALEYASQTRFSKAQRASQLGSITYYFPGQG
ncbi:energy transducer TonB family protein [Gilvibacter sediminis]|uniref:energy transducer TonB family protein n=1 Tax=Gilvibacter sediminis TaxID=379071 RepID=UPI00235091E3|nr:energy transducer TonB [Gilvibacter sediminis]MDC7997194.1 TonB family protein [Gilvibacter sediminis]